MSTTETQAISDMPSQSGRIIKGVGGLYTVRIGDSVYTMNAKGIFRKDNLTPLPGDVVDCTLPREGDDNGVISAIRPRKNSLIRPACANIDRLIIVACKSSPKADLYTLDKLSAVAVKNGIEVVFVFNKADADFPSELAEVYRLSGFRVFTVSVADAEKNGAYGEEFASLRLAMQCGVNIFSGASGVGKSSIIGHLFPEFAPETGVLSRKISRGRHTTRATELYLADAETDTYIADTPGFSMFDAAALRLIEKDELVSCFPDIEKYSHGCRYRDCSHTKEGPEDCTVTKALEEGLIAKSRHQSYCTLREELGSINEWDT